VLIFISYSSQNRNLVQTLSQDLEQLDHEIWFDKRLVGGQSWWDQILDALEKCDLFIFAMSQQSVDSYPCRLEYQYAKALNKNILPVQVADVNFSNLPPELSGLQTVDYRDPSQKQAGLKLALAINQMPAPATLPKPLPPRPPLPVSPLTKIRQAIDSGKLPVETQQKVFQQLQRFANDADSAEDARELLRYFSKQTYLNLEIAKKIQALLTEEQSARPKPKTKASIRLVQTLTAHTNHVMAATFDKEKNIVITAGADGKVIVWNCTFDWMFRINENYLRDDEDSPISVIKLSKDNESLLIAKHTGRVSVDRVIRPVSRFWVSRKLVSIYNHFSGKGQYDSYFEESTDEEIKASFKAIPDLQELSKYNFDNILNRNSDELDTNSFRVSLETIWVRDEEVKIIHDATFSPDNRSILTAGIDGILRIWGTERFGYSFSGIDYYYHGCLGIDPNPYSENQLIAGLRKVVTPKTPAAHSICFSPDGVYIFAGHADGKVKQWDFKKRKELKTFTLHSSPVIALEPTKDGRRLMAVSRDGSIKIMDIQSGKILNEFKGHRDAVNSAQFSPDERSIVTTSDDGTAIIWETATGRVKGTIDGHSNKVTDARFSPDGSWLVTASWDTTAKVWDVSDL
jgi:WD40 repeat protein